MNSMFKDLGIFKLHSGNDPSLKQGLTFDSYRKKNLDSSNYDLLQQSTSSNMSSIVEAMSSINSNNGSEADAGTNNTLSTIKNLDSQFQKLMSQYTTTLNTMNEEVATNQDKYSTEKNMFGKVVTNQDSSNVYVNNYGYTHVYSTDAWDNNDSSCPTTVSDETGDLTSLPAGPAMGVGQPCKAAGKNVQNTDTGEYAWVDIQGIKHVYSAEIWDNRSPACMMRDSIQLSDFQYKAIPSGSSMTSADNCQNINVDPTLYNQLATLNTQLSQLAIQMVDEIDKLVITDAELNADLQKQRADLNSYLDTISADRTALQKLNNNYSTINAQNQDAKLKYTANNYEVIAWTLVALAIGGITARQIMTSK